MSAANLSYSATLSGAGPVFQFYQKGKENSVKANCSEINNNRNIVDFVGCTAKS